MDLYSIGELARRSGVPVKTIRYYSDLGVLPPARVTSSRYRLYSEVELVRLGLIRALRAAGFDLPTIGELLAQSEGLREAVQLQLEAVELQLRTLQRQRQVLRAALRRGDSADVEHLARTALLTRLEAAERDQLLRKRVQRLVDGVPVDPAWWEQFLDAASPELPDDPSDEQLSAWLELAELSSDPAFVASQREQAQAYWTQTPPGLDFDAWCRRQAALMERAGREEPTDALLDEWVALQAELWGCPAGRDFEAQLLSAHDAPLAQKGRRYWELVAVVRGEARQGSSAPHDRLIEGLRRRARGQAGVL